MSTCVNIKRMRVHVKNLKKYQLVHWLGLTELNKTIGKMRGRNSSKQKIADEML